MNNYLWMMLVFPLAWPWIAKILWPHKIQWMEMFLNIVACSLLVSFTFWAGTHLSLSDVEVYNGEITSKTVDRFECPTNTSNPCENGYDCHCHQVEYECGDAKQSRTCYEEECDTCYEYPWEQNWYVHSNIFEQMKIRRVDDQGAVEPPRWTITKIGDASSRYNSFQNIIGAASASLFYEDGKLEDKYKAYTPQYPNSIFDYYRVDRVVPVGINIPDIKQWNLDLSNVLKVLGPNRHANAIIIVTEGLDRDYAGAVRRAWKGYKQNDIIIYVGLYGGLVTWVEVHSWSKQDMFNVVLRDEIYLNLKDKPLNRQLIMTKLSEVGLKYFERRSMEEFEYLRDKIEIPAWIYVLCMLFGIGSSIGLSILFYRIDLNGESGYSSFSNGSSTFYRNRFRR